jgi:hypothetical protein
VAELEAKKVKGADEGENSVALAEREGDSEGFCGGCGSGGGQEGKVRKQGEW